MQKFFDRKIAYQDVQEAVKQINKGIPAAVWIEGHSGVGKTRFMEYICEKEKELNFFTFLANEVFYKCERGSVDSSFEFTAAVIFELQRKNPGFFERFIQNYFDCVEHISFLDACCLVLPQIKGFSAIGNLIETKYKNIVSMQSKISDRLVTYQLIDLFSDLILSFLKKVYKAEKITFCIDDAQWLDQTSVRVFETLIKKSKIEEKNPSISIFLNIREKSGLSDEEKQNYLNTYRVLSYLYPDLKTIYLDNFDLPTTSEVIQETKRYYLIEQIPLLYKVTNGNPLELEHTLRFPDERVRAILQRESRKNSPSNQEDMFTIEHIAELYYKKPIYSIILNILSVLRRRISVQILFQCVEKLFPLLLQDVCLFSDFLAAINYLEEKEYVTYISAGKEIALTHDSIYRTVLDYLSQNGDYILYGKTIAAVLLVNGHNNFLKEETHQLLALKLLCEVDPQECFESFQNIYAQNGERLEEEFFLIGAEAFCSSYFRQNKKNIQFAIYEILPKLVSSANLIAAQRLCHTVYLDAESCLSLSAQIIFLINYIKTQTDLSVVDAGPESAIPLFEKLYLLYFEDADLKLQALLLGMSAYEHVLKHNKILELFSEAETVICKCSSTLSSATMSVFYRNKGLCFPHSELKNDYFQALRYATHIANISHRHLLFGTSMNNLGLSYFYNGNIKMARRAFFSAKKHLEIVGYNTARISNNIGACCYMLHEWQDAYHHFSIAASGQTDGIFMQLCIQTNLALALYSVGKQAEAKLSLDELIDEYIQGKMRSRDTLIYCAAMINRGYIAFQEKDYFKAADYYQRSLLHTYRYQNSEQLWKRKKMRDISLQYGIESSKQIDTDMDLTDISQEFYKKPYSLVPFAFYVI